MGVNESSLVLTVNESHELGMISWQLASVWPKMSERGLGSKWQPQLSLAYTALAGARKQVTTSAEPGLHDPSRCQAEVEFAQVVRWWVHTSMLCFWNTKRFKSLYFYFYWGICACLCVCHRCGGVCAGQKRVSRSPGTEVRGSCEPLNISVGNQTWVLGKSSSCTPLLPSSSSFSSFLFLFSPFLIFLPTLLPAICPDLGLTPRPCPTFSSVLPLNYTPNWKMCFPS